MLIDVIGACGRSKSYRPQLGEERRESERMEVKPLAVMKTGRSSELLPAHECTVFLLGSIPSAVLFHTVAYVLHITLLAQESPET